MLKDNKMIGVIVFVIIGLIVALAKPFAGLEPVGHYMLATVVIALGMWIFRPGGLPFTAGGAVVLAGGLMIAFAYSKYLVNPATQKAYAAADLYAAITGGFVSSAVWTLIPALYFGFVLQKTGLGKRIAYMVLKSFTPSWLSMAVSWLLIGVALSALTPSIAVRIAIVMPIAIGVVEACKLDFRSKGGAFITLMAWAMCLFPGTGWLTGSLSGPIMQGFLPAELKPLATFDAWFQILALPWFVVTIVFSVLAYLTMKPKDNIGIPIDTFKDEYKKLGDITRDEIITAIVLVGSLVFFATERIHGIPTAATALAALFILIMFKIITAPEISTGISWDVVIFFGVTIGLSAIFKFAKISAWFEPIIKPTILGLAPSALTLMLVATFGIFLIRFLDVPWGFTTIALTATVLIPIYNDFGIHPLVVTMAYVAGINFFLLSYQQPFLLMAEAIQGRSWAPNHVTVAGLLYIVSVVVAILVAMPYWKAIGVIR